MHPLCYYRIDNIEVEPQPVTPWELRYREIMAVVPKSSHAQLDKIMFDHFRVQLRGRREVLVNRRSALIYMLESKIKNAQAAAMNEARRKKFIGPLTIQMRNGHPF